MEIDPGLGDLLDMRYDLLLEDFHDYFRMLAPRLDTGTSRIVLRVLDLELINLMTLLDFYLTSDSKPPTAVLGLYLHSSRYMSMRGLWQEKRRWGMVLLERMKSFKPHQLAGLLNNLGTVYDEMADYQTALKYYEHSLVVLESVDPNDPAVAQTYSNMAVTYWQLEQLELALDYAYRALTIEQQHNNRHAQAMSLMNISGVRYAQWKMADSLSLAQEAITLAQETGDVYLQAQFTSRLATTLVANLMFDEAVPVYEEALRLLTEIDDEIDLARAQYNYGLLCRLLRQPDRVRQLAQASLAVFERYHMSDAQRARELLSRPRLDDSGKSFTA